MASFNLDTNIEISNSTTFSNDNNFIHLDNKNQIKLFKRTYNNLNYGHICCEGKGILVLNKSSCELNKLKKEFLSNYEKNSFQMKNNNVKGECGICYDIKSLIKTNCDHLFCKNCITEWIKKSNTCPMCRNVIN